MTTAGGDVAGPHVAGGDVAGGDVVTERDVAADRGDGARLRPLTPDDLPRVAVLERELFGASAWSPRMLAEELGGPARHYVAAVATATDAATGAAAGDAPALIGYAGLWFDGEDAQVMTIGVDPVHQRRRVGRLLLDALVDRARELGARSVLLEVRVDNVPALALYERVGFTRLGRRRGYYQPEDVDAWTMRLDLRPDPSPAPPPDPSPHARSHQPGDAAPATEGPR